MTKEKRILRELNSSGYPTDRLKAGDIVIYQKMGVGGDPGIVLKVSRMTLQVKFSGQRGIYTKKVEPFEVRRVEEPLASEIRRKIAEDELPDPKEFARVGEKMVVTYENRLKGSFYDDLVFYGKGSVQVVLRVGTFQCPKFPTGLKYNDKVEVVWTKSGKDQGWAFSKIL